MSTTAFVLVSYLLGSLSFAVIVSKMMGLADPRSYGSNNPGATNVLRSGKRGAAVLTLLGDGIKGGLAVSLAKWLAASYGVEQKQVVGLCALAVVAGHMWPVFFGFKGGKGVATTAGVLFGLNAWLALTAVVTWGLVMSVARVSSLAALTTALLVPLYAYLIEGGQSPYFGVCVIIAILIIYRHKANLINLFLGQEARLGDKRRPPKDPATPP